MPGTEGRVYGGNPKLIHIADGERGDVGYHLAGLLDQELRERYKDQRTEYELITQKLCPGCYMIAAFNMLLTLACMNGQSRTELARSMSNAFDKLAENPDMGMTEEIKILLDPEKEEA